MIFVIIATCGEDVTGPELYCKLVGSSTSNLDPGEDINIIKGQVQFLNNSLTKLLIHYTF